MKKVLLLALCFGLCGCATAYKLNSISIGMNKNEVIKIMGQPISTSVDEGTDCLNYKLQDSNAPAYWGYTELYFVRFKGGKVISYGKKDPTQVIKFSGDLKTDETIKAKTENNEELTNKLKTLNKLLTEGLITKSEFDEQKKKLLNDYTSKQN